MKRIEMIIHWLGKAKEIFKGFWVGFKKHVRFRRISRGRIRGTQKEALVFTNIRNELERLPYFLEYYRSKGIDRFFIVDNNSTDGSREFLLDQKDVCVYFTDERYLDSQCGIHWMKRLLNKYGQDRWCLMVDVDEIFVYPHWEEASIKDLCAFLDSQGKNALKAFLLDMYADGFPSLTDYRGKPLWEIFSYFDSKPGPFGPQIREDDFLKTYGNVRMRVFGVEVDLQKFPLLKYQRGMEFLMGFHRVSGIRLSDVEGVLMHFKFDASFFNRCYEESVREEHWMKAAEYKRYAEIIREKDIPSLCGASSTKFESVRQLMDRGLMKTSSGYDEYLSRLPGKKIG